MPMRRREQAREAYLKLAKLYHPDRYAAADLPREVRDYLAVMVRRINAAHDAVQVRLQKKAAPSRSRCSPSRARAEGGGGRPW